MRPLKGFHIESAEKSDNPTFPEKQKSDYPTSMSDGPTLISDSPTLMSDSQTPMSDNPSSMIGTSKGTSLLKLPKNTHTAAASTSGGHVCVSEESEESNQPTTVVSGQPLLPKKGRGGDLIVMPVRDSWFDANDGWFSAKVRRRYAADPANVDRDGRRLEEGWIQTRNNKSEDAIAAWLEREARKSNASECPYCKGAGGGVFVTKDLLEGKGARKCPHAFEISSTA